MKAVVQVTDMASARLFVYGTLRRGFSSHEMLRTLRARFLAKGHVHGKLYDLGDYPGAVSSERDADQVVGEVYVLTNPARAFSVLDRFEAYDAGNLALSLFERKETTVTLAGSEHVQSWIYWLRKSRWLVRPVPSGDYATCRR